jgi:chromosome segregation ATPase
MVGLEDSTHPTNADNARRLADVEEDIRRRERELTSQRLDLEKRELALRQQRDKAPIIQQQNEFAAVQRELADLRQQLLAGDEKRRAQLAKQQAGLQQAASNLQTHKRQIEAEAQKQAELSQKFEQVEEERGRIVEECRHLRQQVASLQNDWAVRSAELEAGEKTLAEERAALEKSQTQHRGDLVRLDRRQGDLEAREKDAQARTEELDRGFDQLRQNVLELEEQARQMDEWHTKLAADAEAFTKKKNEHDTATAQLHQRAAALEGQQAMLATLRTRLERMREDVRREEKQLAEQRVAQAASEADLQRLLKEAEDLRAELENEKHLRESESAKFHERQTLMEAAVTRLRAAQDATAQQEMKLHEREAEVARKLTEIEERAAVVEVRAAQLASMQERMNADRDALAQREVGLTRAEETLAGLQEQLRRRSEELANREKSQSDHHRRFEETMAALDARREELGSEQKQAEEQIAEARQQLQVRETELDKHTRDLDHLRAELLQREETLLHSIERLKAAGRAVGQGRKELADERARSEADKERAFASLAQAHRDFEAARDEVIDLQRQLPELEAQAREAADRLAIAREQLRGHVAEAHAYTRQSREDLELLRAQVRAEAERVRQQETTLHRDRDEHRLAVAQFRQQLIHWQGQVEDLKRALARGENRLERKRAEVDRQVRAVDETSQRLARQAEELEQQERAVVERRGEVERHLEDMRLWYRRKLRELAGIPDEVGEASEGNSEHQIGHGQGHGAADERNILSLTGEVTPADKQLGDLLQSLQLVDADTLTALLVEARRQRRSLRQLLLAGNHLTLYQVALIEAGNLDALMLGPVRVVDRIRTTPAETIYRVFDPRCNQEALLRHLNEEEMQDAVRPDEYRQRFAAAAAVRHTHIAATLEMLEIAGRPAVLQESLKGLASNEWPPLTGTPGVWYRLVNQTFLGLHAAHQAGLVHGHLSAASILLTSDGVLKLCRFGEPAWLADASRPESAESDIAALGALVSSWVSSSVTGKQARVKPLPGALQGVLDRLATSDPAIQFTSAAEVLEALERAGAEVPANAAAWDRFVQQVSEQATDAAVRLSA